MKKANKERSKKRISLFLAIILVCSNIHIFEQQVLADEIGIPEPVAIYDFETMGQYEVVQMGNRPVEVINDFNEETGNGKGYVLHIPSSDESVPEVRFINPFAGMDLSEEGQSSDVRGETYEADEFGMPIWDEGVVINYWIKTADDRNTVVLNFRNNNRLQYNNDDWRKHLLAVEAKESYDKSVETGEPIDSKFALGELSVYLDEYGNRYNVYNGGGEYMMYHPEYDDGYQLGGDIVVYKEGTDPDLISNWTTISALGSSKFEAFYEVDFNKNPKSEVRQGYSNGYLQFSLDGSVSFTEDDGSGINLNPYVSLENDHEFNVSNYLNMKGSTTLSDTLSTENNNTNNWHMVTIVIQNDWIDYYLDGVLYEDLIDEFRYFEYIFNVDVAGKSFNAGFGLRTPFQRGAASRADYLSGNRVGSLLTEWLSLENTTFSIGGINQNAISIGFDERVEEFWIDDVAFYNTLLDDDQVWSLYEDGISKIQKASVVSPTPEDGYIYTSGDYSYRLEQGEAVITSYIGTDREIVVPDIIDGYKVTGIGNYAFYDCNDLISIIIPETITFIGTEAFAYSSNLLSIVIPDSLMCIGDSAFLDCYNLFHVFYLGSEEQWNNILIGEENDVLDSAMFHHSNSSDCFEIRNTISATCTMNGTCDFYCDICSEVYNDKVVEYRLGHKKGSLNDKIEPTCTDEGYSVYQCLTCSEKYNTEYIREIPHNYNNGVCSVCGEKILQSANIVYNNRTVVITIDTEAFSRFDVAVISDATCESIEFDTDFNKFMSSSAYTHAAISNRNTQDFIGNKFSVIVGAGETSTDGSDIPYEGTLARFTYENVEEGTEFIVVTDSNRYDDITTAPQIARLVAIKTPEETHICNRENVKEVIDPTCTDKGYTIYLCLVCNEEIKDDYVDALGHSYTSEVIEPTCTEKGYTEYICAKCNDAYKDNYVDELGHVYGEWQIESSPNCTNKGTKYKICSTCEHKETEAIPALGHSYTSEVIAPTCTEKGYTEYTCAKCNDAYKDNYVDELGHVYGEWQIESSSNCTSKGTRYKICSTCEHKETEAIPALGHSYSLEVEEPTCIKKGYTVYTCSACTYSYIDSYVKANGHSYGDWIFDVAATVLAEGSQHRVCSVCEHSETQTIDRIEIDIGENRNYGLAIFTVVNAQTLEPINGAQIFISTEKDGENTFTTDSSGQVRVILPVGKQNVSVYSSGCLTRNLNIDIKEGINEINQIGLSDMPTYDAEITSTLMTIEEIEEAGIDTSDPSNKYVYKYELKLELEPGIDISSIVAYFNADGTFLGGYSPDFYGYSPDNAPADEEKETIIDTNGIRVPVGDDIVTVYPVNEYFYLIIRGEVTWLKEMFDVEMLIINNSKTDTLENLTATLELPKGLSLAKMVDEQQTLAQEIDYIGEGESKSVHWYVRGDTAGSYSLNARLEGMVMPFEEPIDDVFVAENQLQVWASDALHLHFEFPNAAYYGEDYPITITLTNVSDITLYNINHLVQIEQGMNVYYLDGTTKDYVKIDRSSWNFSGPIREFHPGDKIIIETSVNIFFESEIMQRELEKYIGIVDGIEQLINGFKAVKAVFDVTELLFNCVEGCIKAMDNFINSVVDTTEKMTLFMELHDHISSLVSPYTTTGNDAIDIAIGLANSSLHSALKTITSDPEEWYDNVDIGTIQGLLGDVSTLGNAVSTNEESNISKFDLFDSIRTAISAIPIVFSLKNIIMTVDKNNTTSVPCTYSVYDASTQYFGVSNVSQYIMAIVQTASAEIYDEMVPGIIQLFPGLDDPFNKEEAIKYIQATENEIAQFKAKDATGKVSFKVWVEPNNVTAYSSRSRITTSDFILSCDNETATHENGVLTFTGEGMISVTPQSKTGGTLYIEDSEGNINIYVIDVVEEHICIGEEEQVVIGPTSFYDGFAVKCCGLCGEIMEIIPLYYKNCCEEHSFSEWMTDVTATCVESGLQKRYCESCGFIEFQFIGFNDHMYENWEVVNKSTCVAEGKEISECTICGILNSRMIKKVPHIEMIDSRVEATETDTGLTEGKHCSVCGEVLIPQEIIPVKKTEIYYYGDISGDGTVNAGDALAILKHAAKLDTIEGDFLSILADINGDGNINASDALEALKVAAKLSEVKEYHHPFAE